MILTTVVLYMTIRRATIIPLRTVYLFLGRMTSYGTLLRDAFMGKSISNACYQLGVHESDIHKTAFKTPFGLFKWTVIPQGLYNAPATFQ